MPIGTSPAPAAWTGHSLTVCMLYRATWYIILNDFVASHDVYAFVQADLDRAVCIEVYILCQVLLTVT